MTSKALTTVDKNTALARPDWIKSGDTRGAENIRQEDLRLPRVQIAQALSPQVQEDNPAYIEGLKMGHFYNTLTRENYGPEIEFTVIRVEIPRGIEFFPMEEGGGIKDPSVPLDDPRMEFTTDSKGRVVKPVATKFHDYIVVLLPSREPAQLSFKSSAIGCAKDLNSLMKLQQCPTFYQRFRLSTETKSGKVGKYAVPVVNPAGYVTEDEGRYTEGLYNSLAVRRVVLDADADEDEAVKDVPF